MLSADQVPINNTQSHRCMGEMGCPDLRNDRLGAFLKGDVFPLIACASLSRPLTEDEQAAMSGAPDWGITGGATVRRTLSNRMLARHGSYYTGDFRLSQDMRSKLRASHKADDIVGDAETDDIDADAYNRVLVGIFRDDALQCPFSHILEKGVAKKTPYSVLDPNSLLLKSRPGWSEDIQKAIEGKPIYPVRFRFFVDGYHFYLNCKEEAEHQAEYVRWIFQDWSHCEVPDLPIDANILAEVGHSILSNAERRIAEIFVKMGAATGRPYMLSNDVAFGILWPWDLSLEEQLNDASAILDPFYTVDIFAARNPSIHQIQRRIREAIRSYRGAKDDESLKLLKENYQLVEKGKFKSRFKVRDFGEYEKFLSLFQGASKIDRTHFALTRYGTGDDGGVWFKEKGVDAMLIMALLDAKDEADTDAICLIANDGDYYPILERIKSETPRPVFPVVFDNDKKKNVSWILKKTVGEDHIVKVAPEYIPWQNIQQSNDFMLAESTKRMADYENEMQAEMDAQWAEYEAEIEARLFKIRDTTLNDKE